MQHDWFDTQRIACRGTEFKMMETLGQRRTGKRWRRQVVEFGEKAAFLPVAARREGRVAGDAERMMDGIFRWSSRAHRRIVVPFRTIAERYQSSAENCRPTMGQ